MTLGKLCGSKTLYPINQEKKKNSLSANPSITEEFNNLELRMRELPLLEKKRIDEQENFYLLCPIQGEALNHNISVIINY
ncbi:MAG: hypothetical protein AAGJ08_27455 [Cyanobacteria bacterium P01_H01_bin.35]